MTTATMTHEPARPFTIVMAMAKTQAYTILNLLKWSCAAGTCPDGLSPIRRIRMACVLRFGGTQPSDAARDELKLLSLIAGVSKQ